MSIACRYVSALICMYACMYACELGGSFAGGSPCLAYIYIYIHQVCQFALVLGLIYASKAFTFEHLGDYQV